MVENTSYIYNVAKLAHVWKEQTNLNCNFQIHKLVWKLQKFVDYGTYTRTCKSTHTILHTVATNVSGGRQQHTLA